MRKVSLSKQLFLCVALLFVLGCNEDNDGGDSAVNVEGRWQANMQVANCAPAAVCSAFGFREGLSVVAVMDLEQDGNDVEGTYTYQGAPLNARVTGNVSGNQLVLNGTVSHLLGQATVNIVGAVSNDVIDAAVHHDVNLTGGGSGTINGSGDFTR